MRKIQAFCRWAGVVGAVSCVLVPLAGCTRQFFRNRADQDVAETLHERDVFPAWKIQNMHVYPHPDARFADHTKPDRPPMPPDDPAAHLLAPGPQKPPRRAGIARIEGKGYLDLLAGWDEENRARRATKAEPRAEAELPGDHVVPAAFFGDPAQPELPRPQAVQEQKGQPPAVQDVPTDRGQPTTEGAKKKGFLLDLDQSLELALINSREFQTRREDLYLSALPVTRERFAFAAQGYALGEVIRERTGALVGPGKGDRWRLNSEVGVGKLFSTGALLLVQFANQTVIELTNPALRGTTSVSTVNLDFVQPLLRGGGRAVALEPLTQAERNLLYEIRDYARFRKLFYQYMTAGGAIPVGGGFSQLVSGTPRPAFGVTFPGASSITPGSVGVPEESFRQATPSNGYLNTLLQDAQLEVDRQNVTYLEHALRLFENYERGGRIAPLQVGLLRQQLLQGQVIVLRSEQEVHNALDGFKLQLGIPQDVPLELDDCVLRNITRQLRKYDKAIKDFEEASDRLEKYLETRRAADVRLVVKELISTSNLAAGTTKFKEATFQTWEKWRGAFPDTGKLRARVEFLDRRIAELADERERLALDNLPLEPAKAEELQALEAEYPFARMELAVREYEGAPWEKAKDPRDRDRLYNRLAREVRNAVAFILIDASNERLGALRTSWPALPPTVVDGVDLITADLECAYDAATKVALENRLDLMNARAQVHDAWRKIAVFANSLLGTFNVAYHLDSSTPPDRATPLAFQPERTRHQLVMNLELPLVRLSERNAYRAALIGYQRARRSLQEAEDLVANQVRFEVRQLRVIAESFKIQQQAVDLSYRQVESSLEAFRQPPPPEGGGGQASDPAALTQQLLSAYRNLPSSQNFLISNWIDYRINRQQLYLDLELMQIDPRGVWSDELSQDECTGQRRQPCDERVGPRCAFGQPGPVVEPAAPAAELGVVR